MTATTTKQAYDLGKKQGREEVLEELRCLLGVPSEKDTQKQIDRLWDELSNADSGA